MTKTRHRIQGVISTVTLQQQWPHESNVGKISETRKQEENDEQKQRYLVER